MCWAYLTSWAFFSKPGAGRRRGKAGFDCEASAQTVVAGRLAREVEGTGNKHF